MSAKKQTNKQWKKKHPFGTFGTHWKLLSVLIGDKRKHPPKFWPFTSKDEAKKNKDSQCARNLKISSCTVQNIIKRYNKSGEISANKQQVQKTTLNIRKRAPAQRLYLILKR